MQTAQPGVYRGLIHCAMITFKEDGIASLFRGATPACTTAIIENTLVFAANTQIKNYILSQQADPTLPLPLSTVLCTGAFAGFFQGIDKQII